MRQYMGVRFGGVQQELWSKYNLIIAEIKLTITDKEMSICSKVRSTKKLEVTDVNANIFI